MNSIENKNEKFKKIQIMKLKAKKLDKECLKENMKKSKRIIVNYGSDNSENFSTFIGKNLSLNFKEKPVEFERKVQISQIFTMYNAKQNEKLIDVDYIKKMCRLLKSNDKNYQDKINTLRKDHVGKRNNFEKNPINNILNVSKNNFNKTNFFHMTLSKSDSKNRTADQNFTLSAGNETTTQLLPKEKLTQSKEEGNKKDNLLTFEQDLGSTAKNEIGHFNKDEELFYRNKKYEEIYDIGDSLESTGTKLEDEDKIILYKKLDNQYQFLNSDKISKKNKSMTHSKSTSFPNIFTGHKALSITNNQFVSPYKIHENPDKPKKSRFMPIKLQKKKKNKIDINYCRDSSSDKANESKILGHLAQINSSRVSKFKMLGSMVSKSIFKSLKKDN